jgi:hypothetical protein
LGNICLSEAATDGLLTTSRFSSFGPATTAFQSLGGFNKITLSVDKLQWLFLLQRQIVVLSMGNVLTATSSGQWFHHLNPG